MSAEPHTVMIAIDDSDASLRAVSHVASLVGGATHVHVRLLHVLPRIPTGLLEHGGRDTPEEQQAVERELDEETARWRAGAERDAAPLIDAARAKLEAGGVAANRIEIDFAAPLPEEAIGFHVLHAALEGGVHTVVVGRAPRSWLADALHRSPSSELFRKRARGLAVCIVT